MLDDLGCVAILNRQKRHDPVSYELFSKKQLQYLADKMSSDD